VRNEVKDGLGRFRMCADLMVNPMGQRSPKREREMRIGKMFPRNDTELHAYVTGLDKVIRGHAAGLAANGFRKEEQAQLIARMAEYLKLLAIRGKERGKVRANE
jgi:hypothetical protein